jgi:hypothetical protein
MSLFLRIYTHLLPTGAAWRLGFQKQLTKFFNGLTGFPSDARAYADLVFLDAFPSTTRQVPLWRSQFGIEPGANDAADRLQLDTAWKSQGGQDPDYLQSILQGAGFPLYMHEWWTDDPPFKQPCCGDSRAKCGDSKALASSRSYKRFVRDPRNYTLQPATGTVQCSAFPDQPQCSSFGDQPQSNAFLSNEPGYLVNLDLTRSAPPAIPDDTAQSAPDAKAFDWVPATWPYFFYVGGATFPNRVSIPASRRAELERLVLKLRPSQQWVVMLVDYVNTVDNANGPLVNNSGQEILQG